MANPAGSYCAAHRIDHLDEMEMILKSIIGILFHWYPFPSASITISIQESNSISLKTEKS